MTLIVEHSPFTAIIEHAYPAAVAGPDPLARGSIIALDAVDAFATLLSRCSGIVAGGGMASSARVADIASLR